jgi:hypothetical protein
VSNLKTRKAILDSLKRCYKKRLIRLIRKRRRKETERKKEPKLTIIITITRRRTRKKTRIRKIEDTVDRCRDLLQLPQLIQSTRTIRPKILMVPVPSTKARNLPSLSTRSVPPIKNLWRAVPMMLRKPTQKTISARIPMIRIRRIERRTKNPLDDVPDLDLDPEVDAVHEADHDQNHVIEEENASEIGIETETKIANHVTKSAIIRTEREICLKIEVIETIRTKKRKEIIGIKSGTEIPKIKNEIATEIEIRKLKPKTKRKETLQKIKKRTLRNEIAKIRRIKMTRSEHPRIPQKIRNARRIVRSKTTKSAKARTKKKIKAAISKKNKKIARKKRRTRKI